MGGWRWGRCLRGLGRGCGGVASRLRGWCWSQLVAAPTATDCRSYVQSAARERVRMRSDGARRAAAPHRRAAEAREAGSELNASELRNASGRCCATLALSARTEPRGGEHRPTQLGPCWAGSSPNSTPPLCIPVFSAPGSQHMPAAGGRWPVERRTHGTERSCSCWLVEPHRACRWPWRLGHGTRVWGRSSRPLARMFRTCC